MRELFDFFNKLESEEWSGEVQVTSSQGNAFVVIYKGKFLYAYRPLDRAMERIEKLEWIHLPPWQVASGFKDWSELISSLINLNQDRLEQVIRYLKSDRFEIFFRIFFWSNIELLPRPYEFNPRDEHDLSFYTTKPLTSLLREAQTRIKEWPTIQRRVGSSRRVFISRVPMARLRGGVISAEDAIDEALSEFDEVTHSKKKPLNPYSDEQLLLIQLCDGKNSVEDIIRQSPDGEFLTLRRLLDLWDKGVIAPREDENSFAPRRSSLRVSWKEFRVLAFILLLSLGLSSAYRLLLLPPKAPASVPAELSQALEVHRLLFGRYPVTLRELQEESSVIAGPSLKDFDYHLLSVATYELKARPH